MKSLFHSLFWWNFAIRLANSLRYSPDHIQYNLNQNETADHPLHYSGQWRDHSFTRSPSNWRFPIYTIFLDRFVNGDPSNDNANGTVFEHDPTSTQLRHGGDIQGLIDSLDYIQGTGVKGIYIAGSPFINQPWQADSYSPLDLTLLDAHFGSISEWRRAVDEIHKRGMYILLDNTVATMGDLIGFQGHMNDSAPFLPSEYKASWKTSRNYHDFKIGDVYNETCSFPRFWNETGYLVDKQVDAMFRGCYDGEFDQFGDTEAFGVYPDYRRQLTKFASVQDRLREWVPSVRAKLELFSCLAIRMLDIDGFRFDKAIQVTVDASGDFSSSLRRCAKSVGKENFFLPGEITGGNNLGSVYLGRGRQPDQWLQDLKTAVTGTETSKNLIRGPQNGALDAAAFHYSVYRFMTRFLGMDGNLEAGFDLPMNWVDAWNQMLLSNDFINANTGAVDPRHMYGVTNQDVFRWPAIRQGTERMLLGQFITSLLLPGIPLVLWGEEQAFYVLDNTADNYIFGRQAMSSSPAWHLHGCYSGNSTQYFQMPLDSARAGCHDLKTSLDHRDPSHPVRNIIKALFFLREQFPVLTDGFFLQQLSNRTEQVNLPGSNSTATETGIWSVLRSGFPGVQQLGNSSNVWLVYHNKNETTKYSFNCSSNSSAFLAPFPNGVRVKNLIFPHDELVLDLSPKKLFINGSQEVNGCAKSLQLDPFEFRAYVPFDSFVPPPPLITKFVPGHDTSIVSTGLFTTVNISFHFSVRMDCDRVSAAIDIRSVSQSGNNARIDPATISCDNLRANQSERAPFIGALASAWSWSATLVDVSDGVHQITVSNATTADLGSDTRSVDRFLIRVGRAENPIVYPTSGNYSKALLSSDESGKLWILHKAPGADMWRYTLNWGSSWSEWTKYTPGNITLNRQTWSGTKLQEWSGTHVMVQYWSRLLGSSSFIQHGDVDFDGPMRRFPHLSANGPFNQFGYDAGQRNSLQLKNDGQWEWHYMDEWPGAVQLNVWGMNPDEQPDQTFIYGDIDGDFVLDRLPPAAMVPNIINISQVPPAPYLAYRIVLQDSTLRYQLVPQGNMWVQLAFFILLWLLPIVTGFGAVSLFIGSFYKVKVVEKGVKKATSLSAILLRPIATVRRRFSPIQADEIGAFASRAHENGGFNFNLVEGASTAGAPPLHQRRTVLIATIEYNIDDWNIKVKIGGLGVMAQLMGKALHHQDVIWVVPCVGDIKYPFVPEEYAEPMDIHIFDKPYQVEVHYHRLENITFVILDAPIFRQQTKAEPYPPRMDNIDSAIYYSAWNQCVAQAIQRFPVDLYHINDYHGGAAPLYLLPKTIPCCLSLHNAEFQGLWPLRTPDEVKEVCGVYNLPFDVVQQYVQFGSVFNLLHAAASYLRIHQGGYGAVGVSKKYGDRSFARYPIFWGLPYIGQLPNPDPTDMEAWNEKISRPKKVHIDKSFELARREFRVQAQEWAGLETNPDAELFVFVGRWSQQKGVDLIADVFPAILDQYPNTQLICIGPTIDLYGKFAALKLVKLMELYPKRVFSKPEFTQLPPYIFSGAEFSLIPSRDEPFGLVAVEFGRKGALGIGARVGGLGQMPGWWFTIESSSTTHLLSQFKQAIVAALETNKEDRAIMRAWSAKQRFPVAQWLEGLERLQSSSIKRHGQSKSKAKAKGLLPLSLPSRLNGRRVASSPQFGPVDSDDYLNAPPSPQRLGQKPGSVTTATTYVARSSSSVAHDTSDIESVFSDGESTLAPPRTLRQSSKTSLDTLRLSPSTASVVDVESIVGGRTDFKLQQVDPFFTDADGKFFAEFEKRLDGLSPNNSTSQLCIEEYLVKSERQWFGRFHEAKIGGSPFGFTSKTSLISTRNCDEGEKSAGLVSTFFCGDEFGLAEDYVPPTGLKRILQIRLGTWPVYSVLLALGQIIASNSYQITLLTGEIGQSPEKLYAIASVYLITTILWGTLARWQKTVYSLSLPWAFYGLAFLLIGVSPFLDGVSRGWMQNVATGLYAAGSSSGAVFFAFNFGDEGGAPISTWIWRACVIQGVQQSYGVVLWYWGSIVSSSYSYAGSHGQTMSALPVLFPVTLSIALLLWSIGIVLFLGLPQYYRQTPDAVPSLYASLFRRKTVLWFFISVLVQNYFLSTPYGRTWLYLFRTQHVPTWVILLLTSFFFILLWIVFLAAVAHISKRHPWSLPLFALGLGSPRWAQMLWGTSGYGLYLPWAGSAVASTLLGRALWLWLGLLDTIQSAGVGMMLMLTLTRLHMFVALLIAQVLGSAITILARLTAPNNVGPGDVFPDLSEGLDVALRKGWFWAALGAQLLMCAVGFKVFRKEQISKP